MTAPRPADKLTILGTSAGMPQPDRAGSGCLLTVNGRHSLLDCGGGICASFLRRGCDPLAVDRVFVTHTHPDHCTELPLFLQMLHLAGRTDPVELFVPDEFVEPLRALLAAMYIPREKLPFEPRLCGYSDGFRYSGDFTLTARANDHLVHNRELFARLGLPNRMQSHSFDIAVGERRLVYSGDLKAFEEIRPWVDGCACVLIEATHVDLPPLVEFARSAAVGRWIFTHVQSAAHV
ncbi:MAG TPA: ribonuclease Z, partial [candidate division Zixibacteria bacterium]|nr:ribonuclease Z [candidate division Zixibacteria bacterium]